MTNTDFAGAVVPQTNNAAFTETVEPKKERTHFAGVVLPESLQHTLLAMGYKQATPIQQQAIPVAMNRQDILGSAQTGTGKTAAFAIPLVARIHNDASSNAIVITPTRELAMQVMDIIGQLLGKQSKIKRATLIGGASMHLQLRDLKNNPRIIVGTPGRINDHLKRRTLDLSKTNFLVLDETDKMLDMGFAPQIDNVVKFLPQQRQTLMFSATMPDNIVRLANKNLNNPVRITVGSPNLPVPKIKQDVIHTKNDDKYTHLASELNTRMGSVIIFVKTKRNTDKLGTKLKRDGHSVDVIHGDLRQGARKRVIENFRDMKLRILVATDVASRGLDIPHIEHVINYDLPQVPEDYIHRIGRTGRAGAEGSALCLISPDDRKRWREIEKLIDPNTVSQKGSFTPENRGEPSGEKQRDYSSKRKRYKEGRGAGKNIGHKGSRDRNHDRNRNNDNRNDNRKRNDDNRGNSFNDQPEKNGNVFPEKRTNNHSNGFPKKKSERNNPNGNVHNRDRSNEKGFKKNFGTLRFG